VRVAHVNGVEDWMRGVIERRAARAM